ncbi:hypothetical protein [Pimelobacter simplex]|uniref:hypothetical protein n=1 Tax=Nocardioides simplex TaxID=2045 RepID=UPI0021504E0A|nr:hypothetical protein [Pimelobacter simplex]UUW88397.1 hypothetical protein M0M43_21995 [Pimelobacter simplex]UUW97901.1 hypothetical protein M0M48_10640 [Pimelobacter simplex]
MDNPATPDDLTARGYTGPATTRVQQTRLDEAWRALQRERELPGLVARIDSGELDEELVVDVIAAAALRVLRNPEGTESESGAIDDYQESVKYADPTQDVYFTAAEIRRLQPAVVVPSGYVGSMKYC